MTCVDARTSSASSAISAGFIRRAEEGTSLRFGDLTEVAAIGVCAVSRMFCFFSALPKTKNHRDADRNRCPECRPSGVQGCQAKGNIEGVRKGVKCRFQFFAFDTLPDAYYIPLRLAALHT